MQVFCALEGWLQALIACTFTWAMTAAGASLVLFMKRPGRASLCFAMAASAGIMLASVCFSLLVPAVERGGESAFAVVTCGFVAGGAVVILTDLLTRRAESGEERSCLATCAAVTVHNIPEGLAVGVAFGAAAGVPSAVAAAAMLAFGIGVQNFPEGMCVAFPLRASGYSRAKSFFLGQLSGAVEVFSGVAGALAVAFFNGLLPFALSFSAGAMVAVVCSELIPAGFSRGKTAATAGVVAGFALMMILDIALG